MGRLGVLVKAFERKAAFLLTLWLTVLSNSVWMFLPGMCKKGCKHLVYSVQNNVLALTCYERVRGWTHDLGVDVVPVSKNGNCVGKRM